MILLRVLCVPNPAKTSYVEKLELSMVIAGSKRKKKKKKKDVVPAHINDFVHTFMCHIPT